MASAKTILALLVVCGLTSTVVSIPVIDNISVTPTTLTDGGTVDLTVDVTDTASTLRRLHFLVRNPAGDIIETFLSGNPEDWTAGPLANTYTRTVTVTFSPWGPSGTYTITDLYVQNSAIEETTSPAIQSIVVTNTLVPNTPTFDEVLQLAGATITDGTPTGVYSLKVTSNAPPVSHTRTVKTSGGAVFTTSTITPSFSQISEQGWQAAIPLVFNHGTPADIYTLTEVSVTNEGGVSGSTSPNLAFNVTNTVPATTPVLTDAAVLGSPSPGSPLSVSLTVSSNAPPDALSYALDSPSSAPFASGNLIDIGWTAGGAPDVWTYILNVATSASDPPGVYTLRNVVVTNEGLQSSAPGGPYELPLLAPSGTEVDSPGGSLTPSPLALACLGLLASLVLTRGSSV